MSAVLPGPGIEVEVALGLGQQAQNAVWDAGEWDASYWANPDTTMGDWVDVSCSVIDEGLLFGAGASADGVVTRWEAATCAFTLYGDEYDPRSGPWAGLIGPSLPVRVRWRPEANPDWLTAFIGFIDDNGFSFEPKTRRAQVAATDGTRLLTAFDGVEQSPVGAGETASQRVTRIADLARWPADRRDITPGGVTVKSTTLADNAWTMLLQVADTDLALLWLDRDGNLAYRPQAKVIPSRTISAVVSCDPNAVEGVVSIVPVDIVGQQPNITRNIVSVSRQKEDGAADAVTVTLEDEPSISRFLPHSYQRTDLIHTDDAWSQTVATAILEASAWPSTAPQTVHLDSRADHAASALLLALEPSLSIGVDDGVNMWQCEPSGWSVSVYRSHVEGEITLLDVTRYWGSEWDTAVWDEDEWGYG